MGLLSNKKIHMLVDSWYVSTRGDFQKQKQSLTGAMPENEETPFFIHLSMCIFHEPRVTSKVYDWYDFECF